MSEQFLPERSEQRRFRAPKITPLKATIAAMSIATALAAGGAQTSAASERSEPSSAGPSGNIENPRQRATAEMYPSDVDNLETYGENQPLNQESLNAVVEIINRGDNTKAEDTFYSTIGVTKSTYDSFNDDYDESFQSYLLRSEDKYNEILTPEGFNFKVRRVIIVEDGVDFPRSHHQGYTNFGFKDSDGTWYFYNQYRPDEYSYYDPESQVDIGLLHELGHSTLHVQDGYTLDFNGPHDAIAFENSEYSIPNEWRTYHAQTRPDLRGIMIAGTESHLDEFTALILKYRLQKGLIHDDQLLIKQSYLSAIFPDQVELHLFDSESKPINQQDIESIKIYRTQLARNATGGIDKELMAEPIYEGTDLTLVPDELFPSEEGLIKHYDGLLFIVVETKTGPVWRWLDLRDFSRLKLMQETGTPVSNDLSVVMASGNDTPDDPENWRVGYGLSELPK